MTDDVQVANRRLDASANEALIGMARMGADAFGYTADLRIDRRLAQLLRLRVSQLNNCTYCLNLHADTDRDAAFQHSMRRSPSTSARTRCSRSSPSSSM